MDLNRETLNRLRTDSNFDQHPPVPDTHPSLDLNSQAEDVPLVLLKGISKEDMVRVVLQYDPGNSDRENPSFRYVFSDAVVSTIEKKGHGKVGVVSGMGSPLASARQSQPRLQEAISGMAVERRVSIPMKEDSSEVLVW